MAVVEAEVAVTILNALPSVIDTANKVDGILHLQLAVHQCHGMRGASLEDQIGFARPWNDLRRVEGRSDGGGVRHRICVEEI